MFCSLDSFMARDPRVIVAIPTLSFSAINRCGVLAESILIICSLFEISSSSCGDRIVRRNS